MIYSQAVDYVKNIERSGSDYGIERMRELLKLLGEPDRALKFVHIAGTNGKGSVSAYLTSVLVHAGYKVGTYNSPSVFCYNERWLLDGAPLSDEQVASELTAVRNAIEREDELRRAAGGRFAPTAFEIETAVAFLAFLHAGCDICVLECGLGGRWDATNVIYDKELAVITPIGLDHCALLGDTLGEIAAEKAAIVCGDVVTTPQCDEVMRALSSPYRTVGDKKVLLPCRLHLADEPYELSHSLYGQTMMLGGERFSLRMLGKHQLVNAAIAVKSVQILRSKGWNISDEALHEGIAQTVWCGRFEVVRDAWERFGIEVPKGKTLVLDGAHNPHGAAALAQLVKDYPLGKIHAVVGMLADKDVVGTLSVIAPLFERMTAVTPPSPRALSGLQLQKIAKNYTDCDVKQSVGEAVECALLDGDADAVLVAGSLTLFGALKENKHGC